MGRHLENSSVSSHQVEVSVVISLLNWLLSLGIRGASELESKILKLLFIKDAVRSDELIIE